ncbi:MAG: ester cyclase [Gammaproteobacteria bacterium]
MDQYEAQVRKFYAEIWDKKNLAEIPNILHSDFLFRGSLGREERGHEGFATYVNDLHSALSDYHCLIEDIVVQPGKVFAKMLFGGVHDAEFMGYPATHKKISWAGAALFRFSGLKISQLWVLGDLKSLEQQLSHSS